MLYNFFRMSYRLAKIRSELRMDCPITAPVPQGWFLLTPSHSTGDIAATIEAALTGSELKTMVSKHQDESDQRNAPMIAFNTGMGSANPERSDNPESEIGAPAEAKDQSSVRVRRACAWRPLSKSRSYPGTSCSCHSALPFQTSAFRRPPDWPSATVQLKLNRHLMTSPSTFSRAVSTLVGVWSPLFLFL